MRAILAYHSIDESESVISVSASAFRKQMQWLSESKTRVVSLREIVSGDDTAVAITFDDAFQNFAEVAFPVLEELSLPATLFVVTGHAGGTNDWQLPTARMQVPELPLLDWTGIARVAERGIEIGAHGRRHLNLRKASAAERDDEIHGAATDMAREIGKPPAAFAYPYGEWNSAALQEVNGTYQLACTTDLRLLSKTESPTLLPRLDMYYLRGEGQMASYGSASFARYIRFRGIGRSLRRLIFR